jgi:predicted Zn-dependent protease
MTRIITSLVLSAVLLWAAVPAQGYIYQYNSGGRQLRWQGTTITVAFSSTLASANVAGGDAVGAARRALARWSAVTNIQFVETSSGATTITRDTVNLITFTPLSVSRPGTTRVTSDTATGTIVEADIGLNSNFPFSTNGAANTYDLESTIVHEVGHLLGLDHSGVVGATMQPSQGLNFTDPAFSMRTLSDDDLAGIRSVYGQRSAFAVGSIAGQVNYGAGAHVWVENLYTGRVTGSSITKSDGSYRIDQLPTSDYRVYVEYLDEPVFARDIAVPPSGSNAHPYIGIGNQPAFRATEVQTPVNVSAGNTTILNPIVTLGAPSFNPRILGINGVLQAAPTTLAAGRVYRFTFGGSNLAGFPLTTTAIGVTSPFMSIDPASFTREDPSFYFANPEPNYGIISFNLVVADNAKFGDYTLRLRSATGETAYLAGALALDPYTNFVEPNPLENNGFFVRQQYLDFLFREPEPEGFNAWVGVLNRCAANPSTECDRVTVSASFFRAPEFQLKGFFIYRFYAVAFGRLPKYVEIIPDLQFVTGQTEQELNARRDAYTNAFVQRTAFRSIYDPLSNADYVDRLLRTAGVTITNRDQLVNNLNTGAQTRAQVLRAIVESQAVQSKEFNPAFVAMQYFGYLKRDPEAEGFNAWLNYLNANPSDFRTMVNGFVNSIEYRTRFGQP